MSATPIFIHGLGAVSPAGWGLTALREAVATNQPLPAKELPAPGGKRPPLVRQVPTPKPRPAFLTHPRLRRCSPITHFAAAAALEALGSDAGLVSSGVRRLGIVLCALTGCVNYSHRFYDETLRDPATASPLVFPETVFNAPASHLAALLGTTAINYTLVGDPGTFVQGLALAAHWLDADLVDGCLVIGAEEMDWLTANALRLFSRASILSDGAGALYLRREASSSGVRLAAITDAHLFFDRASLNEAVRRTASQLGGGGADELLCESTHGLRVPGEAEAAAWRDWPGARLAPKRLLGEGLTAAAAWQCVLAVDEVQRGRFTAANVIVTGCNEQAIGARFVK